MVGSEEFKKLIHRFSTFEFELKFKGRKLKFIEELCQIQNEDIRNHARANAALTTR